MTAKSDDPGAGRPGFPEPPSYTDEHGVPHYAEESDAGAAFRRVGRVLLEAAAAEGVDAAACAMICANLAGYLAGRGAGIDDGHRPRFAANLASIVGHKFRQTVTLHE